MTAIGNKKKKDIVSALLGTTPPEAVQTRITATTFDECLVSGL